MWHLNSTEAAQRRKMDCDENLVDQNGFQEVQSFVICSGDFLYRMSKRMGPRPLFQINVLPIKRSVTNEMTVDPVNDTNVNDPEVTSSSSAMENCLDASRPKVSRVLSKFSEQCEKCDRIYRTKRGFNAHKCKPSILKLEVEGNIKNKAKAKPKAVHASAVAAPVEVSVTPIIIPNLSPEIAPNASASPNAIPKPRKVFQVRCHFCFKEYRSKRGFKNHQCNPSTKSLNNNRSSKKDKMQLRSTGSLKIFDRRTWALSPYSPFYPESSKKFECATCAQRFEHRCAFLYHKKTAHPILQTALDEIHKEVLQRID